MSLKHTIFRLTSCCVVLTGLGLEARASLTLTTGLGTTQVGNLVQNGSFENGAPAPTSGNANQLYWATGTTLGIPSVPTGWITSGGPNNYARWGNGGSPAVGIMGSAPIPDGNFALYFGNGAPAMINMAPTFNNDGSVTFSSTPVATPGAGFTPQVILQQTVNTVANPSPYYRFSFWTSGEDVQSGGFGGPGIFGLRVTNVLPGDPMQWLTVPNSSAPLGNDHLYEYTFTPLNLLQNVTIEFHNFGHFDLAAWGGTNFTTELVLDDVIVNTAASVPEPGTLALVAAGIVGLGFVLRRKHARVAACIAAMFTFSAATNLRAGEITSFTWHPGVASLASTSIDPAPTPNDDVAGLSPYELFVTQKDYVAVGSVDIEFFVTDNGGVTEYRVREGVNNSTGIAWTGYHIELGFGHGTGFTKSTAGDGLDFDAPDFNSPVSFNPSPGIFPLAMVTEDDIIASGGVMPPAAFAGYFIFHIDVPDGMASFTLRQSPIEAGGAAVPEPSTLVLAVVGLMLLSLYAWRRRSQA